MRHEAIADKDENPLRGGAVRAEVTLLCEVRQGAAAWRQVRLEDISQHGFRITWLPEFTLDAPLKVRIPGLHSLTAKIRWHEEKMLGCAFEAPLHIAVFEHIVGRSQIDGPLSQ